MPASGRKTAKHGQEYTVEVHRWPPKPHEPTSGSVFRRACPLEIGGVIGHLEGNHGCIGARLRVMQRTALDGGVTFTNIRSRAVERRWRQQVAARTHRQSRIAISRGGKNLPVSDRLDSGQGQLGVPLRMDVVTRKGRILKNDCTISREY